jgi:hypothetical protein
MGIREECPSNAVMIVIVVIVVIVKMLEVSRGSLGGPALANHPTTTAPHASPNNHSLANTNHINILKSITRQHGHQLQQVGG